MRTTYIQDRETGKFITKEAFNRKYYSNDKAMQSAYVQGNFEEFISPVDGSIIGGRAKLREHNKKHGVTDARDYSAGYYEKKAKERADDAKGYGRRNKTCRVDDIIQSMNKLERENRF